MDKPGNEQVVVSAVGSRTQFHQARVSQEGSNADADGLDEEQAVDKLDEEQVEPKPQGEKRKGKAVSTTAAKRQKRAPMSSATKAVVQKPATKASLLKSRKGGGNAKGTKA